MEFRISDYVTIREKYTNCEIAFYHFFRNNLNYDQEYHALRLLGYNPTQIRIKDVWYDVIPIQEVARSVSPEDGGYHYIYIQINLATNEYYIGKVNRKRWSEIKRYQGSGLKFKGKYKGHENEFIRYFIGKFLNSKETEEAEAIIVDKILLQDPQCLNLVCGGGGTSEHYSREARAAHQRKLMKEHPENYQQMINTAKRLYCSGDSDYLTQRGESIKKTMSDERYSKMMSERITRWQREHPEEYQRARENNSNAMRKPEVIEKRNKTRQKWIAEHPEEYKAMQEKLAAARNSPEARRKRAESLKEWAINNPEEAKANMLKRSEASAAKCRKPVNMCDLETGEVIMQFKSLQEAAQWLADNGISKGKNCASSISSVCRRAPCSTGYGYRKKAYGYDWRYAEEEYIR